VLLVFVVVGTNDRTSPHFMNMIFPACGHGLDFLFTPAEEGCAKTSFLSQLLESVKARVDNPKLSILAM